MRKLLLSFLATVIISTSFIAVPIASAETDGVNTDVKLTKEQKEELAFLHKNVMEQKIGIINKYVEYGIFTKEKGKEMIEFMERHYKELEKNEYIPKWDKKHKHHKETEE